MSVKSITGKETSLSLSLFLSLLHSQKSTHTVFSIAEVQPWQKDQDGLEHVDNAAETVLETSGNHLLFYSYLQRKKFNPPHIETKEHTEYLSGLEVPDPFAYISIKNHTELFSSHLAFLGWGG